MRMRERDEHYKLRYGDIDVKCSSDGMKYVKFTNGIQTLALVKGPTLVHLSLKCGVLQKNQIAVQCNYLKPT